MTATGDREPSAGPETPGRSEPSSADDHAPGLGRPLGLTVLGTVLPGAGLTQTRSRRLGWVLLALVLVGAAVIAWYVVRLGAADAALSLAARPTLLLVVVGVIVVGGVVWCASIVLTAVRARPAGLGKGRSRVLAAVTTVLVLAVAAGSFTAADYALITRDTVDGVFGAQPDRKSGAPGAGVDIDRAAADPWATQKRVNILLLGSDAASTRIGTRTDSMILASIDTASGRTTLISLPRNLQKAPLAPDSPLRQRYPSGRFGVPDSACGQNGPGGTQQCMLTNLYAEAEEYAASNPKAYPAGELPGRRELRGAVQQITGLEVDQLVVIDLRGFEQLIDAMGGVVVNVKNAADGTPLPIGGHVVNGRVVGVKEYFEPGRQRLDGFKALWYARSRAADNDTYRQARQRCVVQAIVSQVDPAAMLARYPQLARIARTNIYTDIAGQDLPAFVELVQRVQRARITSVTLTAEDGIYSGNPDYEKVRELVQRGIAPPKPATPRPSSSTDASGEGTTTRTPTPATPSPTTTPYEQC